MPSVQKSLWSHFEASKRPNFVNAMVGEVLKAKAEVVRIHVAGDYYDVPYLRKWHAIVKACPATVFFTYTRSWTVQKFEKPLTEFATLKNLRLWYSVDQETGNPTKLPKRVKTAYMSVGMTDVPAHKINLVFRDYGYRNIVQKYINGVFVCPPENGITEMTCERCGVCWRDRKTPKMPADKTHNARIPLPLAA